MLNTNPIATVKNFIFSNEVTARVFVWIPSKMDYDALSQTCRSVYAVSRSSPVLKSLCAPVRRSLLRAAVLRFPELSQVAQELLKNYAPLGHPSADLKRLKERFYQAFKSFCGTYEISPDSYDYLFCSSALEKMSQTFDFQERIYLEVVQVYAQLPVEEISIPSFRQKFSELKWFYREKSPTEIQRGLRQCFDANKRKAFFLLAQESLKTDKQNSKYLEIKEEARIRLKGEIRELEQETQSLWEKITIAKNEKIQLKVAWGRLNSHLNPFAPDSQEEKHNLTEIETAEQRFYQADRKLAELLNHYEALTYENSNENASQGILCQVRRKLNTLDSMAKNEVFNSTRFYFELAREVTAENCMERYRALRRILK